MILERLGSWEKALEVLNAPLGEPPCKWLLLFMSHEAC